MTAGRKDDVSSLSQPVPSTGTFFSSHVLAMGFTTLIQF